MASWRDKLRPASFKGAAFEVDALDNESGRRAQVHEYPNRDIPYVEDLGKHAEIFTIEAFVIGDDYMDKRDELKAACNSFGSGTLVHPTFGDLTVVCVGCRISESSSEGRMARFSLTFQEAGEQELPSDLSDYKDALKNIANIAQGDIIDSFLENFSLSGVATVVTNSVGNVAGLVSGGLGGALGFVNSQVTELTGLTDSVLGAVSFVTDIWDTAMDAVDIVTDVINTVSDMVDNPLNFLRNPLNFANGLLNGLGTVTAFVSPKDAIKQIKAATNLNIEDLTSKVSQNTPKGRQEVELMRQVEVLSQRLGITEQAKAIAGMEFNNANDAQEILDDFILQIETQLLIENVPTTDAVFSSLQNLQAAAVKDVQTTIKRLPEVTTVSLNQNTPSAVLAYDLYQDLSRAQEIVDRNKVRNPGFVPRGKDLEVLSA